MNFAAAASFEVLGPPKAPGHMEGVMMKRLSLAALLALSVSACAMGGGGAGQSLAYVSEPVDMVPTTRGEVQVVASTDPPGYWIFPDGTRWPMGYAPRRVPLP